MAIYERASRIAEFLKEIVHDVPDTAIVLGSGLGAFGRSIECENVIEYKDIPDFPVSTVPGHEGKLIFGKAGGKRIIAMQGRFHRYEGYSMEDVTLYVRVFQLMGVKNLIVTNAAGAINTSFTPGDLMLITDHISLFCDSPLFGANDDRLGERFTSMSRAYDRELMQTAREAAEDCGIDLKEGVYCYAKGPMFETPAEIRALRALGADACGMSTVAEVICAVHGGMRVLGISCMTNMAAGILDQPLSHAEVIETGKAVEGKFKALVTAVCSKLA